MAFVVLCRRHRKPPLRGGQSQNKVTTALFPNSVSGGARRANLAQTNSYVVDKLFEGCVPILGRVAGRSPLGGSVPTEHCKWSGCPLVILLVSCAYISDRELSSANAYP